MFEKTLCGIPLPSSAELPELDADVEAQAGTLLRAVIEHWSALKNTSIDAFREAFLARLGFIDLERDPPQLIVETRGYDILLSRLPWGIEFVALPWLAKPIEVDWSPTQ